MMQMDPTQSINASHWGNQMIGNGGPMIGGPIGMPSMGSAGFNYNYGSSTPGNNPSFGWPQQWGNNNYGLPPHQAQQSAQGYAGATYDYNGPIGYNSNAAPANYGAANGSNWNSWNPNITSIAPNTGSSSGEMYRPQSGHNMHSAPPPSAGGGNLSKPGSEYNGAAAYNGGAYTNYYNEQQQFSNQQNRPRSYGNNEQYPAF